MMPARMSFLKHPLADQTVWLGMFPPRWITILLSYQQMLVMAQLASIPEEKG
jgi:hypothetical protein